MGTKTCEVNTGSSRVSDDRASSRTSAAYPRVLLDLLNSVSYWHTARAFHICIPVKDHITPSHKCIVNPQASQQVLRQSCPRLFPLQNPFVWHQRNSVWTPRILWIVSFDPQYNGIEVFKRTHSDVDCIDRSGLESPLVTTILACQVDDVCSIACAAQQRQ